MPTASTMPRWAKIMAWVLGSFFFLILIVSVLGPPPSQQTAEQKAQSSAPETATPNVQSAQDTTIVKTTDLQLSSAYADNEVAAQAKYGDKTLWIKGYITGITLDLFNHPVVQMRGKNEFLPVQATFDDSAKGDLAKLRKGTLVTMQCTSITEVVSAPMLSDCSLMDNSTR